MLAELQLTPNLEQMDLVCVFQTLSQVRQFFEELPADNETFEKWQKLILSPIRAMVDVAESDPSAAVTFRFEHRGFGLFSFEEVITVSYIGRLHCYIYNRLDSDSTLEICIDERIGKHQYSLYLMASAHANQKQKDIVDWVRSQSAPKDLVSDN